MIHNHSIDRLFVENEDEKSKSDTEHRFDGGLFICTHSYSHSCRKEKSNTENKVFYGRPSLMTIMNRINDSSNNSRFDEFSLVNLNLIQSEKMSK